MSKLRYLLLLVALLVVGLVLHTWIVGETRTVADLLASARERSSRVEPDYEGALLELDLALERATPEERARVLELRAGLHRQRGDLELALADVRRLLEERGPDEDTVALGASVAIELEQPEVALELLGRIPDPDAVSDLLTFPFARAHEHLFDLALERARALLDEALDRRAAAELGERLVAAAHLRPDHPRREALLEELATLTPQRSERIAALVQEAYEHGRAARHAYLAALARRTNDYLVAALMHAIEAGGQPSDAAELGLLVQSLQPRNATASVVLETVVALTDLDRVSEALALLGRSMPLFDRDRLVQLPAKDLRRWCDTLLDLGQRDALIRVGSALAEASLNGTPAKDQGRFFYAYAALERSPASALRNMEAFLVSGVDPLPGARAMAFAARARSAREAGDGVSELVALKQARSSFVASGSPARFAPEIRDATVRLAELLVGSGNLVEADELYVRAMEIDPGRADELVPVWEELGERIFAETGRRPVGPDGRPTANVPGEDAPAYERWVYARAALAAAVADAPRGQRVSTRNLPMGQLRTLLGAHPNLPLAHVLAAEVYAAVGDESRRAESLLRLGELRGHATPEELETLGALPEAVWTPELRTRFMRLAPVEGGLRPILEHLRRTGDPELVLALLERHRGEEEELLRLDVEVCLERRLHARVLKDVLAASDELFGEVAGAGLLAAQELDRTTREQDRVGSVVERIEAAPSLSDPRLLVAADRLLAAGEWASARRVLQRLEPGVEDGPRVRGIGPGEILVRLALLELLADHPAAFEELAARSEPFFESPAPTILELLRRADEKDWDGVAVVARQLLADGTATPGLRRGLLLALVGQPGRALEELAAEPPTRLEDAVEAGALELCCRLLEPGGAPSGEEGAELPEHEARFFGERDGERDPRTVLAYLAALGDPRTAPWTLARLEELPPTLGTSAWALALAGRARVLLGDETRARKDFERLARRRPPLALGALWFEELLRRAGDREALRAAQVELRDLLDLTPAEDAAAEARRLTDAGQPDDAVEVLERALDEQGPAVELLAELVRVHEARGALDEAVLAESELLPLLPPDEAARRVPGYLECLERAVRSGGLATSARWSLVEALEATRPQDPAPARELARLTLLGEDGSPAGERTSRAWAHLRRFRERTLGASIESLREGEAANWLALFLERDPGRALEFAAQELAADPRNPRTWVLHARALVNLHRNRDALEDLAVVIEVVPYPDALRLRSIVLAELGERPALIESAIGTIRRLEDRTELDAELLLIRALALSHSDEEGAADEAIRILVHLWGRREEIADSEARALAGRRLVGLLAARNQKNDLENAARFCEALRREEGDGVRRDALEALAHLLEQGAQD